MPSIKPNKQPQNALASARSKIAELEKELEVMTSERDQLKEYAQNMQKDLVEIANKIGELEKENQSLKLNQSQKKSLFD